MIDRLRTFIGYREYPKYAIVWRHFIYKQALLAEADRLVHGGVLHHREDIFDLSLEELREVIRAGHLDHGLVAHRPATAPLPASDPHTAPPLVPLITRLADDTEGASGGGGSPGLLRPE